MNVSYSPDDVDGHLRRARRIGSHDDWASHGSDRFEDIVPPGPTSRRCFRILKSGETSHTLARQFFTPPPSQP